MSRSLASNNSLSSLVIVYTIDNMSFLVQELVTALDTNQLGLNEPVLDLELELVLSDVIGIVDIVPLVFDIVLTLLLLELENKLLRQI